MLEKLVKLINTNSGKLTEEQLSVYLDTLNLKVVPSDNDQEDNEAAHVNSSIELRLKLDTLYMKAGDDVTYERYGSYCIKGTVQRNLDDIYDAALAGKENTVKQEVKRLRHFDLSQNMMDFAATAGAAATLFSK